MSVYMSCVCAIKASQFYVSWCHVGQLIWYIAFAIISQEQCFTIANKREHWANFSKIKCKPSKTTLKKVLLYWELMTSVKVINSREALCIQLFWWRREGVSNDAPYNLSKLFVKVVVVVVLTKLFTDLLHFDTHYSVTSRWDCWKQVVFNLMTQVAWKDMKQFAAL